VTQFTHTLGAPLAGGIPYFSCKPRTHHPGAHFLRRKRTPIFGDGPTRGPVGGLNDEDGGAGFLASPDLDRAGGTEKCKGEDHTAYGIDPARGADGTKGRPS